MAGFDLGQRAWVRELAGSSGCAIAISARTGLRPAHAAISISARPLPCLRELRERDRLAYAELVPEKDEIARVLAEAHRNLEATITRIVRIVGPNEADGREPIKLLEVNTAAVASGIWPIAFSPDPPEIPYGSVVVEVSPDEYEAIVRKQLSLPSGWDLGPELFAA